MLAYQGTGALKGKVVPTVYELCQGVLMGEHSSSCNGSDSKLHVNFPIKSRGHLKILGARLT